MKRVSVPHLQDSAELAVPPVPAVLSQTCSLCRFLLAGIWTDAAYVVLSWQEYGLMQTYHDALTHIQKHEVPKACALLESVIAHPLCLLPLVPQVDITILYHSHHCITENKRRMLQLYPPFLPQSTIDCSARCLCSTVRCRY